MYRAEVREDFCECCAYCLLPELLAGGQDNFELDHFHPKSRPARIRDVHDFYNLYYSCHICNHYKANSWPTAALEAIGCRFVDPCGEEFTQHFQPERRGTWSPLTVAGQYAAERLRLNRLHLVQVRELLNEIAELRGQNYIDWNRPARDQISTLLPNGVPTLKEGQN
ncbi:MAG: hypothetical protein WCA49_22865 [Candidatus Sulfotelmatobacter sp.]